MQDKKEDYVASIKGSKFSLNDVNNNLITEKSFQGPATALFFGFTNCPDVCPMTLNKLSIILERLKKENKSLKVFFISIDPERDTSEVMKNYLNSFGDQFIGITGEPETIFKLSQSWGIASQKIFSENGEYTIKVWLQDEFQQADEENSSEVIAKWDDEAPYDFKLVSSSNCLIKYRSVFPQIFQSILRISSPIP